MEAFGQYAKAAGLTRQITNQCAEMKIRFERKAGLFRDPFHTDPISLSLLHALHEFQAVPERVAGVESFESRDLCIPNLTHVSGVQVLLQLLQAPDNECWVCFPRRHEIGVDA